jgi:uncharacterized Ntn-hydrolase superfamily protein
MESGSSATDAITAVVKRNKHAHWRQLMAIDRDGGTAGYTGGSVDPFAAIAEGQNCVAGGNILANQEVPHAMVAGFEEASDEDLPDRLLKALAAGLAAGGEILPLRSAAMYVVAEIPFPYVDLRVDDDKNAAPIAALCDLWIEYKPKADLFVKRALIPDEI